MVIFFHSVKKFFSIKNTLLNSYKKKNKTAIFPFECQSILVNSQYLVIKKLFVFAYFAIFVCVTLIMFCQSIFFVLFDYFDLPQVHCFFAKLSFWEMDVVILNMLISPIWERAFWVKSIYNSTSVHLSLNCLLSINFSHSAV